MRNGLCFLVLAALAAVLTSGCSSGKGGKVTGQVRMNGKPLADAQVSFYPQDAVAAVNQARTDADGRFVVQSDKAGRTLPPGTYRVSIRKFVQKDGQPPPAEDLDMLIASGTLRNIVPQRYSSGEHSPTVEIKAGENDLPPLELTDR